MSNTLYVMCNHTVNEPDPDVDNFHTIHPSLNRE